MSLNSYGFISMFNLIKIFLDHIFFFVKILENILLIIMVILICCQFFFRFADISIPWSTEISLIAMVWVTFLAFALGVRQDILIRISMFLNWMSINGKKRFECFLNIVMFIVSILMIIYGCKLTSFGMHSKLPATGIPTAIIYVIVPISAILSSIQLLYRFISKEETDTAKEFIYVNKEI